MVVYDPVGGDLWKAALRAANFEARLLPIGFASGEVPQIPANILLVKNLTVIGLYWGAYYRHAPDVMGSSLRQLIAWWEEGRIRLMFPTFCRWPRPARRSTCCASARRRARW
jgi:NADPH2:quinone reductase